MTTFFALLFLMFGSPCSLADETKLDLMSPMTSGTDYSTRPPTVQETVWIVGRNAHPGFSLDEAMMVRLGIIRTRTNTKILANKPLVGPCILQEHTFLTFVVGLVNNRPFARIATINQVHYHLLPKSCEIVSANNKRN